MPKSRKRRRKSTPQTTTRTVKMSPRVREALEEQLEAFKEKFGREPGPGDPVFFDPDCDVPVQLSEEKLEQQVLEAMLKAGTSPEYAYAYRKTGLLSLGGDQSYWDPADRAEWAAAVAEYRQMEAAAKSSPDKH
jgi:hypothetical protein